MKITIDTKEDSHADIQKVIQILSHLTNKDNITNNYSPEPQETNESSNEGFMNMFGDSSQENKPEDQETSPDFSSFLNLTQKEEEGEKEDKPKLQFF
jgi:hypothetical protein